MARISLAVLLVLSLFGYMYFAAYHAATEGYAVGHDMACGFGYTLSDKLVSERPLAADLMEGVRACIRDYPERAHIYLGFNPVEL